MRPAVVIALVLLGGCGGSAGGAGETAPLPSTAPSVGPGPRHRPPSLGRRATRGLPVRGLTCKRRRGKRYGVHLELFAARRVVLIPPGIGIAPPAARRGAYVSGGRCSYPLRTREPTGVIEVDGDARKGITLADLFAIWGQPLSPTRMAGFSGSVRAYLNGRPWPQAPGRIALGRHAQIVLEVGGYVRPHATYGFPPGL